MSASFRCVDLVNLPADARASGTGIRYTAKRYSAYGNKIISIRRPLPVKANETPDEIKRSEQHSQSGESMEREVKKAN